jgi:signal transduction histidine kinase
MLQRPSLTRRLLAVQLLACSVVAIVLSCALLFQYTAYNIGTIDAALDAIAISIAEADSPKYVSPMLKSAFDRYLSREYGVPVAMFETSLAYEVRDDKGVRVTSSQHEFPGLNQAHMRSVRHNASGRTVIVAISNEDIDYLWRAQVMRDAMKTAAVAILIIVAPPFLLLTFLFARFSLRPLRDLARVLSSRAAAQLIPVQMAVDYPELRPLVSQLNTLLEQLRQTHVREHRFFLDLVAQQNDLLEQSRQTQVRERRFFSDAAHAILTPVAAIQARAYVITNAKDEASRHLSSVEMNLALTRVTRMVRQILDISRNDALPGVTLAESDMCQLVRERIAFFLPMAAAKEIRIVAELPDRCMALIDETSVIGAIDSLIDNAIRYAGTSSEVNVALRSGPEGAEFVVSDDGPGIDPAHWDDIFRRFYRVPGTLQMGSGLGLAIVKQVAELHGGSAWLSDGLHGRGVGVHVTFNAAVPPAREG